MDFIHPHLSLILFGLLLYKVIRDQSLFIYRRGGGGDEGGRISEGSHGTQGEWKGNQSSPNDYRERL